MARLRWQSRSFVAQREHSKIDPTIPEQKRRLSLPRYILLVILIILLFSVITLMIVERRVSPSIRAWAEVGAESLATQAIALAIEETMRLNGNPSEFSTIISDNQGNLQAIQYNTGEINRVSVVATQNVLQSLNNLDAEDISIPLGQITGLDFLAGWGPNIPVRVIPTGSVTTTPISSFESAGINQTIHRIYMDVNITMRVVIPLIESLIPVSASFPIVEEIIVGAVPNWYFGPSGMVGGFQDSAPKHSAIEFELNNLGF